MKKHILFQIVISVFCFVTVFAQSFSGQPTYWVGAYYFPNWHVDARNEQAHGTGWTEWQVLKAAQPRFPGHQQPKVPLWGYEDEADPKVMAKKITVAADHGITHFIFDWYYYDGPFLNRCLDEGYLKASNNQRVKFTLMWANHDWQDIEPTKYSERRQSQPLTLYPGAVNKETFAKISDLVIKQYFMHPSYWKIDNAPYFSIYLIGTFIEGLGGLEQAKTALAEFRKKTKAAGFRDLHLNLIDWGLEAFVKEKKMTSQQVMAALQANSITSYVWIHNVSMPEFPQTEYAQIREKSVQYWSIAEDKYKGTPFHPNISVGWDSSPRTVQSDIYENIGYPFTPVLKNNTPAEFKKALVAAKEFLDKSTPPVKICNINSWNEWTEGSYLEPDRVHGFEYLQAVQEVFGKR